MDDLSFQSLETPSEATSGTPSIFWVWTLSNQWLWVCYLHPSFGEIGGDQTVSVLTRPPIGYILLAAERVSIEEPGRVST